MNFRHIINKILIMIITITIPFLFINESIASDKKIEDFTNLYIENILIHIEFDNLYNILSNIDKKIYLKDEKSYREFMNTEKRFEPIKELYKYKIIKINELDKYIKVKVEFEYPEILIVKSFPFLMDRESTKEKRQKLREFLNQEIFKSGGVEKIQYKKDSKNYFIYIEDAELRACESACQELLGIH